MFLLTSPLIGPTNTEVKLDFYVAMTANIVNEWYQRLAWACQSTLALQQTKMTQPLRESQSVRSGNQ